MGVTLTATAALVAISVGPPAALADNRDGAWYGWQTMTVDAAAVGTIALGVKVGSTPLALSGVGGLVLGAPVLHAMHGNWGNAGLSLSSRVLLPLAGLFTRRSREQRSNGCSRRQGFGWRRARC